MVVGTFLTNKWLAVIKDATSDEPVVMFGRNVWVKLRWHGHSSESSASPEAAVLFSAPAVISLNW